VDVIAAPAAPSTAFEIGSHRGDPLSMYLEDIFTLPANLAGIPGIAFPVGHDRKNLPIGMQLLGENFQEKLLLEITHTYQQHTTWHQHKPSLKW
ncbi:MAG: amidase family protein, partial [Chloroflexota bacterium]